MVSRFVCRGTTKVPLILVLMLFAGLSLTISSCAVAPSIQSISSQEGLASYYSNDFQGRKTSSGEPFDNSQLTAAHRTFPFGTIVRVINMRTSASVEVRINDRGPRKPERIIDLSLRAAREIGIEKEGLGHVRLEVLEFGPK